MEAYPNGVYGINLTEIIAESGDNSLDNRIRLFVEALENGSKEFEGKDLSYLYERTSDNLFKHNDVAFEYFYDEISKFLYNKNSIVIPEFNECFDPESNTCLFFTIEEINSDADLSGMNEAYTDPVCQECDIILGVPIFGFPNNIKFHHSFTGIADWFLWVLHS